MLALNTIHRLDCIEAMQQLDAGCVDLAFADPPFNIGYEYDVYHDRQAPQQYLDWSRQWIAGVHRVLKPTGTFWLAIGDDYAAELKLLSQKQGFYCRSWVIWYYTFGVNCKYKFSRSHTHIFHFVKDPEECTFNGPAIAVPSARQTVYADGRAAKNGRLPDDTWILRPQDLTDGLYPDDDTWYFPRVAGTFKEREGFHGCQMPEQLLGRIIKVSSNPGELVLDPFSGSATTVAVAKKLGRNFIAFDISQEYITRGLDRLANIEPNDSLDGAPEPKVSAPATPKDGSKKGKMLAPIAVASEPVPNWDAEILEAFRRSANGYSADRVVVDPELNAGFLRTCQQLGVNLSPVFVNRHLLRLRKAGKLSGIETTERTSLNWEDADDYLFASEIAWKRVWDETGESLDDILCNPSLAESFDVIARQFAPGHESLYYRWGALKLRKEAKSASNRALRLKVPSKKLMQYENFDVLEGHAGLYMVRGTSEKKPLYIGEAHNLGTLLKNHFQKPKDAWKVFGDVSIQAVRYQQLPNTDKMSRGSRLARSLVAFQCRLIQKWSPKLNSLGLKESVA